MASSALHAFHSQHYGRGNWETKESNDRGCKKREWVSDQTRYQTW